MQGKIIKGIAGFYYVCTAEGEIYACKARGIFRKDKFKPLVGDNVRFSVTDEKDMEGSVDEIFVRSNELIRPAVANVDQALVIFAMADPKPNFSLLDRFLIMMERQDVPVKICFNKAELADEEERDRIRMTYEACGYEVLFTSTRTGEGCEQFRKNLLGRTTVVAGPSGVGKSTLTNLMQPLVQMETGEISKKLGRGKHTTRHSQVIPVAGDTYIVDTPGFTSLYLPQMEAQELRFCYPEFEPFEGRCRFLGCVHAKEPDCAVKEAVQDGKLPKVRYESYLELLEELKDQRKY